MSLTHITHNGGKRQILEKLLSAYQWYVRLFKNPGPIDNTWLFGDFTEADFTGYAPHAIPFSAKDADGLDSFDNWFDAFNNVTFTVTSSGLLPMSIYGWVVTFSPDGLNHYAVSSHLFASPQSLTAPGDIVKFSIAGFVGDLDTV